MEADLKMGIVTLESIIKMLKEFQNKGISIKEGILGLEKEVNTLKTIAQNKYITPHLNSLRNNYE